jgi:hypothetical protein
MDTAARFAGYMVAHAVYSVCDGETLIPILGGQDRAGTKNMTRIMREFQEAAEFARANLTAGVGVHGVAIWDGYVRNLDSTAKVDALFAEVAQFREPGLPFTLLAEPIKYTVIVRYRHAHDPEGFGIFPVRQLSPYGLHELPSNIATDFWQGISDHEEGAKVWRASEIHGEPWPG